MTVDVWKTGEYRNHPGVGGILSYKFWDRLKALPGVKGIYLYGSRARGDNFERSDIDLAISYANRDPYNSVPVSNVIEEADTLLEISATDIDKAEGEFKNNVMKDAIKLYER